VNNARPQDLEVFIHAARLASFAAAAQELGASPAYISKRIALLEDALRGQGVLDVYGQLDGALDNIQTEVRGELRIAASSGLGRNHIAPVLSELVKMHPGVAEPARLTTRDLRPMMLA
jgi:LysR family transcriptional activator of dmlA